MGLFDRVYLNVKCPYCGEKSEMEFQTKDFKEHMDSFRKGDYVSKKFNYLNAVATCHSKKCRAVAEKVGMLRYGDPSIHSTLFEAKVELKDGKVTGKIFDVEIYEEYTKEFLNKPKNKKKLIKRYAQRIDKSRRSIKEAEKELNKLG